MIKKSQLGDFFAMCAHALKMRLRLNLFYDYDFLHGPSCQQDKENGNIIPYLLLVGWMVDK